MKWSQTPTHIHLSINIYDMVFHKLQLSADDQILFIGVKQDQPVKIYEISDKLFGAIVQKDSG